MRPDGAYWVRLNNEPEAEPLIMQWDTCWWWLFGTSAAYRDSDVEVVCPVMPLLITMALGAKQ